MRGSPTFHYARAHGGPSLRIGVCCTVSALLTAAGAVSDLHVLRLSRKDDRLVAKTILALAGGGSAPAFANGQFRTTEDPMVLGGWAPPDEKEWAEMDPADMSETKLPTQGTLTFSATADPGPSGESFLDLVGCGRERPAGAVFLV